MADLEKLSLEVEATSSDASKEVDSLAQSLKNLKGALEGLDTKKLSGMTSGLASVKDTVKKSGLSSGTKQLKEQAKAMAALKKSANFTKGLFGAGFKGVQSQITGITGAMKSLNSAFGLGKITSSKFLASLARIAGYRAVRAIISSVTSGAAEGLRNLAQASSQANATLSQLSSGAMSLRNAMGGALYSVIASIIGLLSSVISAAVTAINWISMLFAILGGRTTFMKATNSTQKFADSLGGAAGAASALKQELMGFDEINSLSPDVGGGGGGGGGGMLDYGSMFEEVPVSESLMQMVENADFTLLGEALANKINAALANIDWGKIKTGAYKLAKSLVTFINGFLRKIDANLVGEAIAGLINAGLTFINTFAYTTDWATLGQKIKLAILRAIAGIKPEDVGAFLSWKLHVVITTLKNFLPSTGEEWKQVTDWIAACIVQSVHSIDTKGVGAIIASLITGALNLIKSLGNSEAITTIGGALKEALVTAINGVSEEDLKAAAGAVVEMALDVIKVTFDLILEIGNTTIGKMLTGYSLFRLFSAAMPALGLKGFNSLGTSLQITGALTFAFEAIANIKDLYADANAGNGISFNKLVNGVISPALKSAGIGFLTIAPHAAGFMLAIGFGIDLVNIFTRMDDNSSETYTEGMFDSMLEPAVNAAESLESLKAVFEQYSGMTLDLSQFETALYVLGGADAVNPNIESFKTALLNLFASFAYLGQGKEITAFFSEVLANAGILSEGATVTQTAAETMSGAADTINESMASVEGAGTSITNATSGLTDLTTDVEAAATAMQATGTQAETLATKIVEIPSDIVYNLELNNYDVVISQFDTLATTIGTSSTTSATNFKTAFEGLPNWFGTSIVDPMKSKITSVNWYSIGNKLMGDFKRGLKSVKLPKLKVEWKSNSKSASILGKTFSVSIPTPSISMYAKGGFPDVGEIFVANEAGPELVGRIGNQPAVANQDQIGDAIFKYMDAHSAQGDAMNYDSMANALVRAMKAAGLGATYLDGKMLKQSLNREAQRSGKPIVGY